MYCLFCVVLCIICVYICTVLLPTGGYPIAVKYIISLCFSETSENGYKVTWRRIARRLHFVYTRNIIDFKQLRFKCYL